MDEDKFHFYEKKTKGYEMESTGDIQKVDLGIIMCHFEIAAKEQGIDGAFKIENPDILPLKELSTLSHTRWRNNHGH